jgi:hypothetical protein
MVFVHAGKTPPPLGPLGNLVRPGQVAGLLGIGRNLENAALFGDHP